MSIEEEFLTNILYTSPIEVTSLKEWLKEIEWRKQKGEPTPKQTTT